MRSEGFREGTGRVRLSDPARVVNDEHATGDGVGLQAAYARHLQERLPYPGDISRVSLGRMNLQTYPTRQEMDYLHA